MHQAAQQYSIDPNAKRTQGEIGWLRQGTEYRGLEALIFKLEPEVVSDPVESPAGWQLVKVLAVVDAQVQNLDDPRTRQAVFRAYMQDRFNAYVVGLRKNYFEVEVYEDVLNRKFLEEAEFMAGMRDRSRQEGNITGQRTEELQKYITPTMQE